MSAPVLESAGVHDDWLPGASRDAEKRALVKRVKAGGAKEGDLLKISGALRRVGLRTSSRWGRAERPGPNEATKKLLLERTP